MCEITLMYCCQGFSILSCFRIHYSMQWQVVYAIMHRQEVFQPFRNHPRFNELIENIYTVCSILAFFVFFLFFLQQNLFLSCISGRALMALGCCFPVYDTLQKNYVFHYKSPILSACDLTYIVWICRY